ncbi:MAG: hypothetical protein AAFO75_09235, partial [Pseudomonadota bacterium]
MVVRKQVQGYFTETPTRFIQPEFDDKRPGSPGAQSLRVSESGWQPGFYIPFDSFSRDGDNTNTAGKMRIVEGRWHVELWVKATEPGQSVELKFHRVRENVFYQEIIPITQRWQKIERRFYVAPGTDPMVKQNANPINFEVRLAAGAGDILIDDMELMRMDQSNPTAFSDNFVNRMKELNPGVVRYWGRQLGSSLDNQIAEPWARRTTGHDPHEGEPLAYNYTLHEFLEFARHIGAEPWYVVPPTFTADELTSLIAYLSAPVGTHWAADRRAELGMATPWTSVFPKIHLEYGNEMWGGNTGGDPFRGASVWNGIQLGDIANDRLGIMKTSPFYNDQKLNLIIGGQAGYPGRQSEISQTAFTHDAIAVAPYYGAETRTYNSAANLYQPLFANPTYMVAEQGKMFQNRANVPKDKELMIYEINSHFTTGGMPARQRDEYVTSMGSGVAHALHMLTYQAELGVKNQAAFTATQFSFQIPGRGGQRVSLWGMLIDSEATGRKRPTWLGMELVNRAIKGNMVETIQSGINPSWKQRPINGIGQQIEVDTIQTFAF